MAVIHHTTLVPSKLELLASWLPSQPWYAAAGDETVLARAGGFRLDDPEGAVGIEFMMVTDSSGSEPACYLVPMSYRGAPLEGAEHALIGETEHGVLGRRWIYDGTHDPVLVGQLVALLQGAAQAQAQSVSDTPDPSVLSHLDGTELDASRLSASDLDVRRRLEPREAQPGLGQPGIRGYVEAGWLLPDGTTARALLVVVHAVVVHAA